MLLNQSIFIICSCKITILECYMTHVGVDISGNHPCFFLISDLEAREKAYDEKKSKEELSQKDLQNEVK